MTIPAWAPLNAAAVTPSDATNSLSLAAGWISFTNSGAQTLKVMMSNGQQVSIVLPSGMYPIPVEQVYSTGTSVTNIIVYW